MARILIVYGTAEGQTAKIAQRIGASLQARACQVDIYDGRHLPPNVTPAAYDAAIIGASVHVGGYQRYIRDFVLRYAPVLARMPSAFFSVSLTEAYPQPEQRAQLESRLSRFFDETGWHPKRIASFAGALAYTKYGFLKRLVMRAIARRVGAPTDTRHDVEYTDWLAVERFADTFATALVSPLP